MIAECLVVEFRVTGDGCPLAEASETAADPVDAAPPLLRADGNTLLRFSTPSEAIGDVLDADDRIRYLHRTATDRRHTCRCLSKEHCVVHDLIDEGFLVESVRYRDGEGRHVGAVVGEDVLRGVLEAAGETVGVQLERVSPLGEEGDSGVGSRWNLTPVQAEAVEAAYEMGYFEVPKRANAAEIAAEIGVSKSAFLERLRRAEAAVFGRMLEWVRPASSPPVSVPVVVPRPVEVAPIVPAVLPLLVAALRVLLVLLMLLVVPSRLLVFVLLLSLVLVTSLLLTLLASLVLVVSMLVSSLVPPALLGHPSLPLVPLALLMVASSPSILLARRTLVPGVVVSLLPTLLVAMLVPLLPILTVPLLVPVVLVELALAALSLLPPVFAALLVPVVLVLAALVVLVLPAVTTLTVAGLLVSPFLSPLVVPSSLTDVGLFGVVLLLAGRRLPLGVLVELLVLLVKLPGPVVVMLPAAALTDLAVALAVLVGVGLLAHVAVPDATVAVLALAAVTFPGTVDLPAGRRADGPLAIIAAGVGGV